MEIGGQSYLKRMTRGEDENRCIVRFGNGVALGAVLEMGGFRD